MIVKGRNLTLSSRCLGQSCPIAFCMRDDPNRPFLFRLRCFHKTSHKTKSGNAVRVCLWFLCRCSVFFGSYPYWARYFYWEILALAGFEPTTQSFDDLTVQPTLPHSLWIIFKLTVLILFYLVVESLKSALSNGLYFSTWVNFCNWLASLIDYSSITSPVLKLREITCFKLLRFRWSFNASQSELY